MGLFELIVAVVKALAIGLGIIRDEKLTEQGRKDQQSKDQASVIEDAKIKAQTDSEVNATDTDKLRDELMRDSNR